MELLPKYLSDVTQVICGYVLAQAAQLFDRFRIRGLAEILQPCLVVPLWWVVPARCSLTHAHTTSMIHTARVRCCACAHSSPRVFVVVGLFLLGASAIVAGLPSAQPASPFPRRLLNEPRLLHYDSARLTNASQLLQPGVLLSTQQLAHGIHADERAALLTSTITAGASAHLTGGPSIDLFVATQLGGLNVVCDAPSRVPHQPGQGQAVGVYDVCPSEFTGIKLCHSGGTPAVFTSTAPLDVNGDGRMDLLAVANCGSGGGFQGMDGGEPHDDEAAVQLFVQQESAAPNRNGTTSVVAFLQSSHKWGFTRARLLQAANLSDDATHLSAVMVTVGDFNRDGLPDVVTLVHYSTTEGVQGAFLAVWYHTSTAPAGFHVALVPASIPESTLSRVQAMEALDCDGDGWVDVMLSLTLGHGTSHAMVMNHVGSLSKLVSMYVMVVLLLVRLLWLRCICVCAAELQMPVLTIVVYPVHINSGHRSSEGVSSFTMEVPFSRGVALPTPITLVSTSGGNTSSSQQPPLWGWVDSPPHNPDSPPHLTVWRRASASFAPSPWPTNASLTQRSDNMDAFVPTTWTWAADSAVSPHVVSELDPVVGVVPFDVDLDGDADLVTVTSNGATVLWLSCAIQTSNSSRAACQDERLGMTAATAATTTDDAVPTHRWAPVPLSYPPPTAGDATGAGTAPSPLATNALPGSQAPVFWADVDGDGFGEVVGLGKTLATSWLLRNHAVDQACGAFGVNCTLPTMLYVELFPEDDPSCGGSSGSSNSNGNSTSSNNTVGGNETFPCLQHDRLQTGAAVSVVWVSALNVTHARDLLRMEIPPPFAGESPPTAPFNTTSASRFAASISTAARLPWVDPNHTLTRVFVAPSSPIAVATNLTNTTSNVAANASTASVGANGNTTTSATSLHPSVATGVQQAVPHAVASARFVPPIELIDALCPRAEWRLFALVTVRWVSKAHTTSVWVSFPSASDPSLFSVSGLSVALAPPKVHVEEAPHNGTSGVSNHSQLSDGTVVCGHPDAAFSAECPATLGAVASSWMCPPGLGAVLPPSMAAIATPALRSPTDSASGWVAMCIHSFGDELGVPEAVGCDNGRADASVGEASVDCGRVCGRGCDCRDPCFVDGDCGGHSCLHRIAFDYVAWAQVEDILSAAELSSTWPHGQCLCEPDVEHASENMVCFQTPHFGASPITCLTRCDAGYGQDWDGLIEFPPHTVDVWRFPSSSPQLMPPCTPCEPPPTNVGVQLTCYLGSERHNLDDGAGGGAASSVWTSSSGLSRSESGVIIDTCEARCAPGLARRSGARRLTCSPLQRRWSGEPLVCDAPPVPESDAHHAQVLMTYDIPDVPSGKHPSQTSPGLRTSIQTLPLAGTHAGVGGAMLNATHSDAAAAAVNGSLLFDHVPSHTLTHVQLTVPGEHVVGLHTPDGKEFGLTLAPGADEEDSRLLASPTLLLLDAHSGALLGHALYFSFDHLSQPAWSTVPSITHMADDDILAVASVPGGAVFVASCGTGMPWDDWYTAKTYTCTAASGTTMCEPCADLAVVRVAVNPEQSGNQLQHVWTRSLFCGNADIMGFASTCPLQEALMYGSTAAGVAATDESVVVIGTVAGGTFRTAHNQYSGILAESTVFIVSISAWNVNVASNYDAWSVFISSPNTLDDPGTVIVSDVTGDVFASAMFTGDHAIIETGELDPVAMSLFPDRLNRMHSDGDAVVVRLSGRTGYFKWSQHLWSFGRTTATGLGEMDGVLYVAGTFVGSLFAATFMSGGTTVSPGTVIATDDSTFGSVFVGAVNATTTQWLWVSVIGSDGRIAVSPLCLVSALAVGVSINPTGFQHLTVRTTTFTYDASGPGGALADGSMPPVIHIAGNTTSVVEDRLPIAHLVPQVLRLVRSTGALHSFALFPEAAMIRGAALMGANTVSATLTMPDGSHMVHPRTFTHSEPPLLQDVWETAQDVQHALLMGGASSILLHRHPTPTSTSTSTSTLLPSHAHNVTCRDTTRVDLTGDMFPVFCFAVTHPTPSVLRYSIMGADAVSVPVLPLAPPYGLAAFQVNLSHLQGQRVELEVTVWVEDASHQGPSSAPRLMHLLADTRVATPQLQTTPPGLARNCSSRAHALVGCTAAAAWAPPCRLDVAAVVTGGNRSSGSLGDGMPGANDTQVLQQPLAARVLQLSDVRAPPALHAALSPRFVAFANASRWDLNGDGFVPLSSTTSVSLDSDDAHHNSSSAGTDGAHAWNNNSIPVHPSPEPVAAYACAGSKAHVVVSTWDGATHAHGLSLAPSPPQSSGTASVVVEAVVGVRVCLATAEVAPPTQEEAPNAVAPSSPDEDAAATCTEALFPVHQINTTNTVDTIAHAAAHANVSVPLPPLKPENKRRHHTVVVWTWGLVREGNTTNATADADTNNGAQSNLSGTRRVYSPPAFLELTCPLPANGNMAGTTDASHGAMLRSATPMLVSELNSVACSVWPMEQVAVSVPDNNVFASSGATHPYADSWLHVVTAPARIVNTAYVSVAVNTSLPSASLLYCWNCAQASKDHPAMWLSLASNVPARLGPLSMGTHMVWVTAAVPLDASAALPADDKANEDTTARTPATAPVAYLRDALCLKWTVAQASGRFVVPLGPLGDGNHSVDVRAEIPSAHVSLSPVTTTHVVLDTQPPVTHGTLLVTNAIVAHAALVHVNTTDVELLLWCDMEQCSRFNVSLSHTTPSTSANATLTTAIQGLLLDEHHDWTTPSTPSPVLTMSMVTHSLPLPGSIAPAPTPTVPPSAESASVLHLAGLADGEYLATVHGIDAAGNGDPHHQELAWVVDTAPPGGHVVLSNSTHEVELGTALPAHLAFGAVGSTPVPAVTTVSPTLVLSCDVPDTCTHHVLVTTAGVVVPPQDCNVSAFSQYRAAEANTTVAFQAQGVSGNVVQTTPLRQGAHTALVLPMDGAGNIGHPVCATFVVDSVAATVGLLVAANASQQAVLESPASSNATTVSPLVHVPAWRNNNWTREASPTVHFRVSEPRSHVTLVALDLHTSALPADVTVSDGASSSATSSGLSPSPRVYRLQDGVATAQPVVAAPDASTNTTRHPSWFVAAVELKVVIVDTLRDGTYAWAVSTQDSAGNVWTFEDAVWFTVDTEPPTAAVSVSPPQATNTSLFTFVASASEPGCDFVVALVPVVSASDPEPLPPIDASPLWQLAAWSATSEMEAMNLNGATVKSDTPRVWLHDGASRHDDKNSTTSAQLQVTDLPQGLQRVWMRPMDRAGNVGAAVMCGLVHVDATPPVTTIVSAPPPLASAASVSLPGSALRFAAQDATRVGFLIQRLQPVDGTPVLLAVVNASTTFGIPPAGAEWHTDGQHTLVVQARDLAGNMEVAPPRVSWVLDTTLPDVYVNASFLRQGRVVSTNTLPRLLDSVSDTQGDGVNLTFVCRDATGCVGLVIAPTVRNEQAGVCAGVTTALKQLELTWESVSGPDESTVGASVAHVALSLVDTSLYTLMMRVTDGAGECVSRHYARTWCHGYGIPLCLFCVHCGRTALCVPHR